MNKNLSGLKSQEGVAYFGFKCAKLNYLFREVVHHDKGIDCEIEITQSLAVKSPIIAVQIKSRSDVYITKENEISLTVTDQNIEYWKSYGRPVILVVYLDETKPMHWVRVDTQISRTIRIPISNVFDESTLSELSQIIMQYYNGLVRSMEIKEVSTVLSEFGFDGTIDNVLDPIADALYEASEFVEKNQYNEAISIYEALICIYKDHCLINYNLGTILLKTDQFDRAFEIADKLYREFPNRYEPRELFGNASASIGNYETAKKYFSQAIVLRPNDPELRNKLGLVHYWNNEYILAVSDFKKSLELEANDIVCFNLAISLTALQNYKEALLYYDEAIKINNKFYDAYNNKGLLLKGLWRIDEAIINFKEAISLQNYNPYALVNIAFLLKDLGHNEEAIRYYKMAVKLLPTNEHIYVNLGLLYCRINDYNKASFYFDNVSKDNNQQQSEKNKKVYIDIGYEVAYMITLEIYNGNNQVISVENISNNSLFNGIPEMRDIVEFAQNEKVTHSILSPEPSETIKGKLVDRNKRIKKKKDKNMNTSGIWILGCSSEKGNTVLSSNAFAIFNIENELYFEKVINEIQRRVALDYISINNEEHSKVNDIELFVLRTETIDCKNQIELKFENRLFQEVYFNINFNGYYLAGVTSGEIDKTYPFLKYDNLTFTIMFTCVTSNGFSKMFAIKNVNKILMKK